MSRSQPTLVIHAGGIGDLILACPAIARLAAEGPLHLAGRPERLALPLAAGIAQAAHDLDAMDFSSIFVDPSPRLEDFLRPYDRVIVWMRDDDHRILNALRRCGIAEVKSYPGLPPQDWTRHASDYYLECLGYAPDPAHFRLAIPPTAEHDVIIHPGSGSPRKNWPLDRFLDLAQTLQSEGRRIIWSLGPAEEGLAIPESPRLAQQSLLDLAGHLAGARLYIGNDSGITHLAAAVGCPTIAIFGPTDPQVWAPKGPHVQIRQTFP